MSYETRLILGSDEFFQALYEGTYFDIVNGQALVYMKQRFSRDFKLTTAKHIGVYEDNILIGTISAIEIYEGEYEVTSLVSTKKGDPRILGLLYKATMEYFKEKDAKKFVFYFPTYHEVHEGIFGKISKICPDETYVSFMTLFQVSSMPQYTENKKIKFEEYSGKKISTGKYQSKSFNAMYENNLVGNLEMTYSPTAEDDPMKFHGSKLEFYECNVWLTDDIRLLFNESIELYYHTFKEMPTQLLAPLPSPHLPSKHFQYGACLGYMEIDLKPNVFDAFKRFEKILRI